MVKCKKCSCERVMKHGFVGAKQRFLCKNCGMKFVENDERKNGKYSNKVRNLAVRMYLNNCGFRRIAEILEVPLATVFYWIKNAAKIVNEQVKNKEIEAKEIEILEMDELFTYIKKNQTKYAFGLLWIGTDLKMLRLKSGRQSK